MEKRVSALFFISLLTVMSQTGPTSAESGSKANFVDQFNIMWSEEHFKTSEDGQVWYLSLDKETGNFTHTGLIKQQVAFSPFGFPMRSTLKFVFAGLIPSFGSDSGHQDAGSRPSSDTVSAGSA